MTDESRLEKQARGRAASFGVPQQADLPQFLPDQFVMGKTKQVGHERIGLEDSPGARVEDDDSVVSRFKESPVPELLTPDVHAVPPIEHGRGFLDAVQGSYSSRAHACTSWM